MPFYCHDIAIIQTTSQNQLIAYGMRFKTYLQFPCQTLSTPFKWRHSIIDLTAYNVLLYLQMCHQLNSTISLKHYNSIKCLHLGIAFTKSSCQIQVSSILWISKNAYATVRTFLTTNHYVTMQLLLTGLSALIHISYLTYCIKLKHTK